jgi:hypothetical protein
MVVAGVVVAVGAVEVAVGTAMPGRSSRRRMRQLQQLHVLVDRDDARRRPDQRDLHLDDTVR